MTDGRMDGQLDGWTAGWMYSKRETAQKKPQADTRQSDMLIIKTLSMQYNCVAGEIASKRK